MLTNYFKIAWRALLRSKLYSVINIAGLTIGLMVCLLIGVYISHELSYDQFHENKNRVVRLTMEYSNSGTMNSTALTGTKPGPQFKRSFPDVESYVRTYMRPRVVKAGDKSFEESRFLYADDDFFKMFSFNIIAGDAATALNAPDKIVISHSMAKKYFGTDNPVNKTLQVGNKELMVSAVCEDVPQESQIKFDFVTRFLGLGTAVEQEQWWTANWITYLLLKEEKSISKVQQQVDEFMKKPEVRKEARLGGTNDYLRYHLEPLSKVHLYSSLAGFEPNGSIKYLWILGVIALLILIIACANYTNLATAQSFRRSSEIGVRKVMGASRRQLFFQFIGESSTITVLASFFALLACLLLVPYFNTITGKEFTASDFLQFRPVLILIAVAAFTSFMAGAYPALVLSGAGIIGVLKKGFSFTGGGTGIRKFLIVLQFSISVFLIVYTTVMLQQMKFIQEKKLGYDKSQILILPIDAKIAENYENIKNSLGNVQGVTSITASYETPEFVEWSDGIRATDEKGVHDVAVNAMPVDLNFTKTMSMSMAAGRDFLQADFAWMDTSEQGKNFIQPYLINENLAQKIGWSPQQAIGRTIEGNNNGKIVGVVKDFHFESLREPVKPMVLFLSKDLMRVFMIRLNADNITASVNRLEAEWKARVPHRPFQYHFLDEDYDKLYQSEQRSSLFFAMAGLIAIILACLGLFGLAAFATAQRVKEIGIRRVLGADIGHITLLISKSFLILVAVSVLIGIPVAWFVGQSWLKDFAYRIHINIWWLAGTAAGVILISWITVAVQAVKAAITNPVKNLRSE